MRLAQFSAALASHPNTCIWWRDDDAAYEGWWHPVNRWHSYSRLEAMLELLSRHNIQAFLAVIPHKFFSHARALVRLLDAYPELVSTSSDSCPLDEFENPCNDLLDKRIATAYVVFNSPRCA